MSFAPFRSIPALLFLVALASFFPLYSVTDELTIVGQRKRLGLAASRAWFKHHPRSSTALGAEHRSSPADCCL